MRLRSPFLVNAAGSACGGCLWALFRTLQIDLRTPHDVSPYNATGSRRFLFSVWHDSAILAAFGGRHTRTVALTSCHRDGSFVERVVGFLGVNSVRGSSGRSGRGAARQLITAATDHDIVITPDGPRGPRRTMSQGIVYLASKSGNAIVPTAFVCGNAWEIRGSWTNQVIPKPFSRVILMAGEPLEVPGKLDAESLEHYRHLAQLAMDELHEQATNLLRDPSLPAKRLSHSFAA